MFKKPNSHGSSGENNPRAKLSKLDVIKIVDRLKNKEKVVIIAKDYNVHKNTIYEIKRGGNWIIDPIITKQDLSKEDILKIHTLYDSGLGVDNTARELNISCYAVKQELGDKIRSVSEALKIKAKNETIPLSIEQEQLIIASLLGDGSLSVTDDGQYIFSEGHCLDQKDYCEYKANFLGSNYHRYISEDDFSSERIKYKFSYHNKYELIRIYKLCFKDGIKVINEEWLNKITLFGIAIWFMDDGSSCYDDNEKGINVRFSTVAFPKKECQMLQNKLLEFGVETTLQMTDGGYGFVIHLKQISVNHFMNLIEVYIIDCMKYKIKRRKSDVVRGYTVNQERVNMNRAKKLEEKIMIARDAYYNTETPIMDDKYYDSFIEELRFLDPNSKILKLVGAAPRPSEWQKVKHDIVLGSLEKANTIEEIQKWVNNIDTLELFICEKLDGISIELIYENGIFIKGITRGDGIIGEEISNNVICMRGVRSKLKSDFSGSLRGEIILTHSNHETYFKDKANTRNAAAGISKRLDGIGSEYLNIIFYQALGEIELKTEVEQFRWLKEQGLATPNCKLCFSIKEAKEYWQEYQDEIRKTLDYEIDGLVVCVNDLEKQVALGDKDMRPKGKIAWKFENAMAESTVIGISIQTGSMGRLTPVAELKPTFLMGVEIKRASLYNQAYIEELKLDIGAKVLICRANDVVPRVEEVIEGTGTVAKMPENCPECGTKVEISGEYYICPNSLTCPAQKLGRLKNWIKDLNILEFGDKILEKLVESGKVNTVADLYRLSVEDLQSLDRMGKRSAQKCYDLLWAGNEITLDVLLGALSIPLIGSSTIRTVMTGAGIKTLDQFYQMTVEQMSNVVGIGPARAQSLVKGLQQNKQLIKELLELGVKMKEQVEGKLSGKSFVLTGKMLNKRADLEKLATDAGATVKGSVSKGSTTHLVIADPNSTSTKAVAARKLGVILISEEDFLKMVNE